MPNGLRSVAAMAERLGGMAVAILRRNLPTTAVTGRWRTPRRPLFWLGVQLVNAATGLVYMAMFGGAQSRPLASMTYAMIIGTGIVAFERGVILQGLQNRIRRLPALVYVPAAELAYIAIIIVGNALSGLLVWNLGLIGGTLRAAIVPDAHSLIFALAASATVVFGIRVRDLIGARVFLNLMLGRYHRPVEEERIFLFIDVVGSTAYAERHGDLAAQAFLAAFFAAIADPVRRQHGGIDDYVGDMALITWPIACGLRKARCVACVFEILAAIAAETAAWQRRFGEAPRFRAALHGGRVVTAEVGIDRHKISYFGDVVNATARIEALCRVLETDILISAELLERLPPLPQPIEARPMGRHAVKGKDQHLTVFALGAGAGAAGGAAAPAAAAA